MKRILFKITDKAKAFLTETVKRWTTPDGEVVWHGVAVVMKYKCSLDFCPAEWEKYWTKYGV